MRPLISFNPQVLQDLLHRFYIQQGKNLFRGGDGGLQSGKLFRQFLDRFEKMY